MTQHINFYHPTLRAKRDWLTLTHLLSAAALAAVVVAALVGWHWSERLRIATQEAGLARVLAQTQAEMSQLRSRFATEAAARNSEITQLQSQTAAQTQVLQYLKALPAATTAGSTLLTALSTQSQPGVWITQVQLTRQLSQLHLEGFTQTATAFPQYLKGLRLESALAGRSFETVQIDPAPSAPGQFRFVLDEQPAARSTP